MIPDTDFIANSGSTPLTPTTPPSDIPSIPIYGQQPQVENLPAVTPQTEPIVSSVPETQQYTSAQVTPGFEQNVVENPIEFIRENTPSNEPVNTEPSILEPKGANEEAILDSKEEAEPTDDIVTMKELLVALLDNQKIRDFSDFPPEMTNPQFYTAESSGREMIQPFGIDKIRFGLDEFSKALKTSIPLDENTYLLKYISGRTTNDGKSIKPRFLKCTKDQVEKWDKVIQEKNQTSQTQVPETNYFNG